MRGIDKQASFKARAIEALAGGAVGAGALGFLGGKTFQTKEPRFWISSGQVYGRDLTKEEKTDFLKRLGKAAVIGASVGAGLSIAGSGLRRKMLSNVDADEAKRAFQSYFESLNKAVRVSERLKPRTQPSYAEASELMKAYRDRTTAEAFVDRARRYRTDAPWGGPASSTARLPGPMLHTPEGTLVPTVKDIAIPGPATAHGQMIKELGLENIDFGRDSQNRFRGRIKHTNLFDRIGRDPNGRGPEMEPGFWYRKIVGVPDGQ